MKIETKFNRDQEVWFMKDNAPVCGHILAIYCTNNMGGTKINYDVNVRNATNLSEEEIFATKEELCKAVFGYENIKHSN